MRLQNVTLTAGRALRILHGEGLVVTVDEGSVWVTQEADPGDHLVCVGSRFRLDRPGLALVRAVSDTRLTLIVDTRRLRLRDFARLF